MIFQVNIFYGIKLFIKIYKKKGIIMYKIMSNNLTDYEAINQIEEINKIFNDNNIVIMRS